MNGRIFKILASLVILALLMSALPARQAQAISENIVISQVYGGGGNSGATYTYDFVELFNRGASSVSLAGWSVQYASATGTGNFGANSGQLTELPAVSLAPGQYLLIQEATSNAAIGSPLPTADVTDATPINMSGSAGKVALVNIASTLGCNGGSTPCSSAQLAQIVDLVGYGSANFFEGSAPAPTLSAILAGFRANSGCVDTDNNSADFTAAAPTPRNTASPLHSCADQAPEVSSSYPADGAADFPYNADLTVTFSEPVNVSDPWFTLSCSTSGSPTAVATGGPTTFTINPDVDLVDGETCTLTVLAAQVTDQDSNDPPDNMVVDFFVGFTALNVCVQSYTPAYQIQGSGSSAAITGNVTTQGVVVGDFEGSGAASGFYLQDATADGDPATSDGIFVFTGSADTVSVGQLVRVTGYARERFNQTALNGSNSNAAAVPAANIVSCGTGSISPTLVNLPFASTTGPERFEGMLVQLPQPLVISEYFNYDRFGEIVLALPLDGETRAFTPTAIDEPGAPAQARALANTLSRITLDDVNSSQNPAMLRHPDGGIFALDHSFRGGDIVQNTVGVLGYDFSLYRIFPTQGADYAAVNPRPAAPEPVGGRLRVAAMNTLNYFLTPDNIQDDSGGDNPADNICGPIPSLECRGWDANQPDELLRQRAKLLATLAGLDADIIGLNELENTIGVEPVANIVSGLNDTLGAGTYAYIDTGVIGTDAIRVGMIYKPGIVTPVGDFKLLTSAVDPRFIDTRSRPVLAQTFEENATGARFTLAVNHLKSKGSACAGDPDTGDGQGNCNQTRKAAAQALVDWLATDPTGSGDADYLIMGDLNSYAMEDPIDAIKAGPDDLAGTYDDYTNLVAKYQGPYAYSYVFDGQAGYLDHALASATLESQVTGAADWHIDADEPDVLDYDTSFKPPAQDALYEPKSYRASDHDPVVVGLDLAKYSFDGYFPPVLNPPDLNVANSGSRQAFKFSLSGDWGLDVFAAGYPRSVQIDCASRSVMGSSEPLATTLTYDPLTGEYVFIWKTAKNIWTGTCLRMNMVLDDGSIHPADFQFTK